MHGNADQLLAAESQASRQSPTEDASGGVQKCPLKKRQRLILKLTGRDGPYARVPYELAVDGQTVSAPGALTGEDGAITDEIPEGSTKGVLRVWLDQYKHPEIYHLKFAALRPVESENGFLDRVRSMGIHPDADGKLGAVHVRELQRLLGLAETGIVDAALREQLKTRHAS